MTQSRKKKMARGPERGLMGRGAVSPWTVECGPDCGLWTVDCGLLWTVDCGLLWTVESGLWTLESLTVTMGFKKT
ncbi:hypothetical protein SARC_06772, partial [Sphaeroforma arctica JP610]